MENHYIHRSRLTKSENEIFNKMVNVFQTDENGNIISPNGTGEIIDPATMEKGHENGMEFRYSRDFAESAGMTQKQYNSIYRNPITYKGESHEENSGHEFEEHNETEGMANVSAYGWSQNEDLAARTYVTDNEDGSVTVSILNAQTGNMEYLYDYPEPGNEEGDRDINTSEHSVSNVDNADTDGKAYDFTSGNDLSDCFSDSDTASDSNDMALVDEDNDSDNDYYAISL